MKGVVIVGTGDHGRVVLEMARASAVAVVGFVYPGPTPAPGAQISELPVLGTLANPAGWLSAVDTFVAAIGNNENRRVAWDRARELGLAPLSMIHPTAILLGGADVRPGAQVCAGAVIGVEAIIGANSIVNTAASVDHDCVVGEHAFIGPGARVAGRARLGDLAHVGLGAVVREGTRIGRGSLVAAGAVVVSDVPDGVRVAGVPARAMRTADETTTETS